MSTFFYATGQAARELGATQGQIRNLCQTGAIAAEITQGGQWRIPKAEVDRLTREGLPPLPRPLPDTSPLPKKNGHGLLAPPSDDVVEAAEDVAITENRLRKRKLECELEETEDFFREREQAQAAREAEEEERQAGRLRQQGHEREAIRAAAERRKWSDRWQEHALARIPFAARMETAIEAYSAVDDALHKLRPDQADYLVRPIVDAAVDRTLAPWQRQQQVNATIERAVQILPYGARRFTRFDEATPWEIRATKEAREAIAELPPDATLPEIEAAAKKVGERAATDYEIDKAATEYAKMRDSIIENVLFTWDEWRHASGEGKEAARSHLRAAMAQLPVGTNRAQLEKLANETLEPFRQAIAKKKQELEEQAARERQQKAEAERKAREQEERERVIRFADIWLPWGMPNDEKKAALDAVRKAVANVPQGSARADLEKARDAVIERVKRESETSKKKQQLIEAGFQGIYPYLQKLENDWTFDEGTRQLAQDLCAPIREALEEELGGDESPEDVAKLVRRLVREELEL